MDHKKQKKQFWVILCIVFLGFIGISMPYLIFPALFLNPDFLFLPVTSGASSRAIFLGITLAAYPLGQFLGSPFLGSLSDDYGRKPLLVGSLFITALCNLSSSLAIEWQYLGLLIFSRFAAGLMEGNIAIARAMAVDLTTIPKYYSFGKINAAACIAYLIGPLLGGLMTDKCVFKDLTPSTPFYFICLLFIGLGILTLFILEKPEVAPLKIHRTFKQRINIIKRVTFLFSNKILMTFLITSTLFTLAVDIFYEFAPVFLTIKWKLSPAQLVIYNAALCLALAIGNGWLPQFVSSPKYSRQAIICSIFAYAFLLLGMVLASTTFLLVLLFTLSGFVIGVASTLLTVKISTSAPDDIQGEVLGVQIALRVLGDAIICLFGGVLLLFSSSYILIGAAFMSIAAIVHYILRYRSF